MSVQPVPAGSPVEAGDEVGIALALLPGDSPLRESCHYVVANPGKRFRAAALESAAGYGERPEDPLVKRAAVAVEMFHAATLAHDDVVDDGKIRRGMPTIGAHAGNLAASLVGGWLFARAGELIAEAGAEAVSRFAETASVVCEGEMLESRDLHDVDRSRARYLVSIEAKTARLIAFSTWLGARVGGASPEVAERLERFGEAVGMAFQITDDILDLTASAATTGKTPGSDLRGGVYTLPTIHALALDPVLRERLLQDPDEEELPELVERIRATGAIDAALAEAAAWTERALEALPLSDPPREHERQLLGLARMVEARVEEARP
ncbi:MAG TPA: polyprenyl synthetase family protein [Solirubrobacterales bacterium]|nr:polyprenyl synthetase family protein [Solirubrobacterales bacterium]